MSKKKSRHASKPAAKKTGAAAQSAQKVETAAENTGKEAASPAGKNTGKETAAKKPAAPAARKPAARSGRGGMAAALYPKQSGAAVAALIVCSVLYFWIVCLTSASTVKMVTMGVAVLFLVFVFFFFQKMRGRFGIVMLLLSAFVLMDGISTLYAVSGKFALNEFLKVLASFCLAFILLALAPGEGVRPGRWIASVLSGYSALAGLVSIDMLSTRWFSGLVFRILGLSTPDYQAVGGVEAGVRMTSLFDNPNVFAGVAGLGVLLSLGLVLTSESRRERTVQTVILYINALAFLLAFSMGASGAILVAFLLLLILERKDRRMSLLILMVETLILTVVSAAVISVTSFQLWSGVQPIPILCTAAGAAVLCLADRFLGERLAGVMAGRGKIIPVVVAAVLAVLVLFAVAAYHITGPVELTAGGSLRRAAYPEEGAYTLSVASDRPLTVSVESQNQQDTMMHTSSILYQGDAAAASFTVPEDSLVVYFNFYAPEGAAVETVTYSGEHGSGSVPLGYKLLPGFMANRLQGLWANENAIQRFVFFADGLKLFARSPLIGLGMGAFENGVKSVQSFAYVTKYAHNHYIQTLAETGVIGLALFLLLLVGSGAAVFLDWRKKEQAHPLTPVLGAALAYMAIHGAIEVVFSSYAYLPIAFGVFALISLCCGESIPKPKLQKKARGICLLVLCVPVAAYCVLLGCNMHARAVAESGGTFSAMDQAIALDKFEWADYALSYVDSAPDYSDNEEIMRQADHYADRLAQLDSNTVPLHLAGYYFRTDRLWDAFLMLEKYVDYTSSDANCWQSAFELAAQYYVPETAYQNGVLRLAKMLDDWNEENMGTIQLTGTAAALVEGVRAEAGQ